MFEPFSAVFGRFRAVYRPRATYLPPRLDALTPEWGYLPTPTGLPGVTTLPWRKNATQLPATGKTTKYSSTKFSTNLLLLSSLLRVNLVHLLNLHYCVIEKNRTWGVVIAPARRDHRKSKFGLRHGIKLI